MALGQNKEMKELNALGWIAVKYICTEVDISNYFL